MGEHITGGYNKVSSLETSERRWESWNGNRIGRPGLIPQASYPILAFVGPWAGLDDADSARLSSGRQLNWGPGLQLVGHRYNELHRLPFSRLLDHQMLRHWKAIGHTLFTAGLLTSRHRFLSETI